MLLNQIGIPKELIFSVTCNSRSLGWITNAIEQRDLGKILYIYQNYIGPEDR